MRIYKDTDNHFGEFIKGTVRINIFWDYRYKKYIIGTTGTSPENQIRCSQSIQYILHFTLRCTDDSMTPQSKVKAHIRVIYDIFFLVDNLTFDKRLIARLVEMITKIAIK